MKSEIELLIESLEGFKNTIYKYNSTKDLFGELKEISKDDKLIFLKDMFRKLLQEYSTDKYVHYDNDRLSDLSLDISRKIIEFEEIAEKEICDGTYGNNSTKNSSVIKGELEYRIYDMISREDFIDIFRGEFSDATQQVIVKISRNTDDDGYLLNDETIRLNNGTLLNEIKTLKYINSIKDADFDKIKSKHYPTLLEYFTFEGRQVSVYLVSNTSDWYDFTSLKEKNKNGIPLYHACWMMERMLSAMGYLHFNKILLGNISPSRICVIPKTHNIIFTDYTFSLVDYASKNAKYIGFTKYFTAPEVMQKASPHPRSDIYSLGMNMLYILGGCIEKNILPGSFVMIPNQKVDMDGVERIRSLILSFINKNPKARSNDVWKAYHQLRELRTETFGRTGFVEFKI